MYACSRWLGVSKLVALIQCLYILRMNIEDSIYSSRVHNSGKEVSSFLSHVHLCLHISTSLQPDAAYFTGPRRLLTAQTDGLTDCTDLVGRTDGRAGWQSREKGLA